MWAKSKTARIQKTTIYTLETQVCFSKNQHKEMQFPPAGGEQIEMYVKRFVLIGNIVIPSPLIRGPFGRHYFFENCVYGWKALSRWQFYIFIMTLGTPKALMLHVPFHYFSWFSEPSQMTICRSPKCHSRGNWLLCKPFSIFSGSPQRPFGRHFRQKC